MPILEIELLELAASGDKDKLEKRVRGLNLADFIRVMKSVQRLDNALCNYGDQWEDSCYWGRGVPFPTDAEAKAA